MPSFLTDRNRSPSSNSLDVSLSPAIRRATQHMKSCRAVSSDATQVRLTDQEEPREQVVEAGNNDIAGRVVHHQVDKVTPLLLDLVTARGQIRLNICKTHARVVSPFQHIILYPSK